MNAIARSTGDGTAASLTSPFFGAQVPASEFFVKGGCHQLALALVGSSPDASFVAIYDLSPPDGETKTMVHAAARIGDLVIDIEGAKGFDEWVDAWSDLARQASIAEWPPGELPFEFTSPAHRAFSEAAASLLREEMCAASEPFLSIGFKPP